MKHKRLDSIGFSKWSSSVCKASVSMQLCLEKMKKNPPKFLSEVVTVFMLVCFQTNSMVGIT